MSPYSKITSAALALAALPLVAAAQPAPGPAAEMAIGDVWITPDALRLQPAQAARTAPASRPVPTGDVWPADDLDTYAAEAAPQGTPSGREEIAAGAVK